MTDVYNIPWSSCSQSVSHVFLHEICKKQKYHKIALIDHKVGIFKMKENMENCPKATNPTNI